MSATWFDPRGKLVVGSGPPRIDLELQEGDYVDVAACLDDWIIRPHVRIGDVIHEIASKDAAHADLGVGPTMGALEKSLQLVANGKPIDIAPPVIVALGDYVARRTRQILATDGAGLDPEPGVCCASWPVLPSALIEGAITMRAA